MRSFDKYSKIISKIEKLTEEVIKNPASEKIKKKLRKAEDKLCRMIQSEEKEIEKLIESINDNIEDEWDE